jgi:hypothetical protein
MSEGVDQALALRALVQISEEAPSGELQSGAAVMTDPAAGFIRG